MWISPASAPALDASPASNVPVTVLALWVISSVASMAYQLWSSQAPVETKEHWRPRRSG